ncbi:MAG: aminoglycoside phosphotransferase family protein [Asgard group archaeon]|nr:aminoglycoside phosphotransferase family protein [Asgard group archaeon]
MFKSFTLKIHFMKSNSYLQMIPDEKIQQLFEKIGESILNSSFLGKGEASIVLKITTNQNTYALKTALYPKRKEKILKEADFRNFFLNKGLSYVPKPVFVDSEIFPNGAVIYEFVNGKKPDVISTDNLRQFAQIISEIHKTKYEIIEDGFSQILKTYNFLDKTTKKIISRFPHLVNTSIELAFENALKEYKQMIDNAQDISTIGVNAQLHGDLSDNFVIDDENKIWLIDWENSEYGDILEEIYWFLFVNRIKSEDKSLFYKEYQKRFIPAQKIKFEELEIFYYSVTPVFNFCWGLDQLAMNIEQNLEPERKLRDMAKSANGWKQYFSDSTSLMIIKGTKTLKEKLGK